GRRVVAAGRPLQIFRPDIHGDLAERGVAAEDGGVEGVGAVYVSPGRGDEREVEHGERAARGLEWRGTVLDPGIVLAHFGAAHLVDLLPARVAVAPLLGSFE